MSLTPSYNWNRTSIFLPKALQKTKLLHVETKWQRLGYFRDKRRGMIQSRDTIPKQTEHHHHHGMNDHLNANTFKLAERGLIAHIFKSPLIHL